MIKRFAFTCVVAGTFHISPLVIASDVANNPNDLGISKNLLQSGQILECGHFPPEYPEMKPQFKKQCAGYSWIKEAMALPIADVPQSILDHKNSFKCKRKSERNEIYACIGIVAANE